jgi:NhaP-type Na+/H+ or K+/H+ antiporter
VFALLSLTVARMLAVAIALVGTHLRGPTVGFIGWFGPRGLASVVFAIIAFDSLTGPDADVVLATITLTVVLSVLLHGVSARPLSRRYGAYMAAVRGARPELATVPALASRPRSGVRRLSP